MKPRLQELSFGSIAHETWANLRSRPWLTLVRVMAVCVAVVVVIFIPAKEVESLVMYEEAQVLAGRDVLVVTDKDNKPLSAFRCDALLGRDEVLSAGGIIGVSQEHLVYDYSLRADVISVTPGFFSILWGTMRASSTSVGAGPEFADRTGATPGANVLLTSAHGGKQVQSYAVDYVGTLSSRFPAMSNAIIVSAPPQGSLMACFVESDARNKRAVSILLSGWFPGSQGVIVSNLLPSGIQDLSLANRIQNRISLWVPLLTGMVMCLLYCLTWWMRRQDIALYRFMGLTPPRMLWMITMEWVALVGAPTAVTVLACEIVLLQQIPIITLTTVIIDCLRFVSILAIMPLLAWGVGMLGRPFSVIKGY